MDVLLGLGRRVGMEQTAQPVMGSARSEIDPADPHERPIDGDHHLGHVAIDIESSSAIHLAELHPRVQGDSPQRHAIVKPQSGSRRFGRRGNLLAIPKHDRDRRVAQLAQRRSTIQRDQGTSDRAAEIGLLSERPLGATALDAATPTPSLTRSSCCCGRS